MLSQNKKSFRSKQRRGFAYRGLDNTKCPIGALIPDRLYHRNTDYELLNTKLQGLCEAYPDLFPEIGIDIKKVDTYCLLEALQTLHDETEPSDWPDGLKSIAEHFNLIYSI